ncbi:hypothetical protein M5D96_005160, partial [Drosophila gunungcola]
DPGRMSMRRQRIKAPANLSLIKRKPRKEEQSAPKKEPEEEEEAAKAVEVAESPPAATTPAENELEVFHSDLEDNVIQMDLQKTTSGFPMSPSKAQARQRVRPTPVFGQRRNSFVASPMAQSPYKYLPPVMSPGMGRIRTESTCSTYSEGGGKQRKDDKSQNQGGHRLNARRDFETRFNKGMMDMIYYNPENNPMVPKQSVTTIKDESNGEDAKPSSDQLLEAKGEGASAMLVPQLKLDANGEMIIDEKTLEIETTAEVEARKIIGTDFSLMCQMFPTRSRRDLKLKYKKEERTNGQLINKALLYPKAFNIQELKDQLAEEDREREENDRQWREISRAMPGNPKKRSRLQQQSKASRTLNDGDVVYENEHVTNKKLGKQAWAKRRKELETDENDGNAAGQADLTPIKQEKAIKTEQIGNNVPSGGELQAELNGLLMDDPMEYEVDISKPRDKTIINMDDGSLTYNHEDEVITPDDPIPPPTAEPDIEQILAELAEGSLALVSSLDPEHEDRVLNEIYMLDKKTGELCETPLNIPEHIVQCIMNAQTMATVPLAIVSHKRQVCSLYKKALRNLEAWYDRRHDYRYRAVQLRARFDENRRKDMGEGLRLLAAGQKELFETKHFQPRNFANSAGGCAFEREVIPPDWLLDYWHPLEKAQYPEYFAKREQRKKEYVVWWEKQYGKPDPKDLGHH